MMIITLPLNVLLNIFSTYFPQTLDPEQLDILTQSEGANNPLWLSMSCEELRVFGIFEKVTEYIRSLPPSLDGLLSAILSRLIREDESAVVEKVTPPLPSHSAIPNCKVGALPPYGRRGSCHSLIFRYTVCTKSILTLGKEPIILGIGDRTFKCL